MLDLPWKTRASDTTSDKEMQFQSPPGEGGPEREKRDIVPLILFPRSNCTGSAAQCKKVQMKNNTRREKGSGDEPLQDLDSAPLTHPDGSGSDQICVQTEMPGGAEGWGVGVDTGPGYRWVHC